MHAGIDIVAPSGTLVKAADGGEIIQAGYDGGYGNSIMVYHGGGYATWYAHLSRILVSVGQTVERGAGHWACRRNRVSNRAPPSF